MICMKLCGLERTSAWQFFSVDVTVARYAVDPPPRGWSKSICCPPNKRKGTVVQMGSPVPVHPTYYVPLYRGDLVHVSPGMEGRSVSADASPDLQRDTSPGVFGLHGTNTIRGYAPRLGEVTV